LSPGPSSGSFRRSDSDSKGGHIAAPRAFSETSIGRYLVYAGPLVWAVLIVFHPNPGGDSPYEGITDVVHRWLCFHVGQLILTPYQFLAVWRLLYSLTSAAARISRAALVVWTVFFSAYDSIQGVATGILTRWANDRAAEEQAAVARAIEFVVEDSQLAGNISAIGLVAGASWLTVAIAAAVALHQAGAGKAVVLATCLSVVVAAHSAPAAIGFAALFLAGVFRERQRTAPALGAPALT